MEQETPPQEIYDLNYYNVDNIRNPYKYEKAIRFSQFGNCLDFGCGGGDFEKYNHNKLNNITACDYSKELIKHCKETHNYNNVTFHNKGVCDFPKKMYNTIFLLDVIEHISKNDLRIFFADLRRCMDVNSKIIIHTDLKSSRMVKLLIQWAKFNFVKVLEKDEGHINLMGYFEMKKFMKDNSFSIVKHELETKVQTPGALIKRILYLCFYPFSASQWMIVKKC